MASKNYRKEIIKLLNEAQSELDSNEYLDLLDKISELTTNRYNAEVGFEDLTDDEDEDEDDDASNIYDDLDRFD